MTTGRQANRVKGFQPLAVAGFSEFPITPTTDFLFKVLVQIPPDIPDHRDTPQSVQTALCPNVMD
jgi:hypothetical protein